VGEASNKLAKSASVMVKLAPAVEERRIEVGEEEFAAKKRSNSESNILTAADAKKEEDEGFYRSFDDDIDGDIEDDLAATVVKRNSVRSKELTLSAEARHSLISSSDSGRVSTADSTYAETSTSSVASNSKDSGCAHCSASNNTSSNTSDTSSITKAPGVVNGTHQRPDQHSSPEMDEVYGSVGIRSSKPTSIEPTYSHIIETTPSKKAGTTGSSPDEGDGVMPPPLPPPRFATVRKSLTLPHISSEANSPPASRPVESIYGVVIGRKGRKAAGSSSSNYPPPPSTAAVSTSSGNNFTDDPGKYMGCPTPSAATSAATLPRAPSPSSASSTSTAPRCRPRTLGFNNSPSDQACSAGGRRTAALNKKVALLGASAEVYVPASAPTTPDSTLQQTKRGKLFGIKGMVHSQHQTEEERQILTQAPLLPPPPPSGILKKSALSTSTPMDLEAATCVEVNHYSCDEDASVTYASVQRRQRWQSNDGLATPGSLQGGMTPTSFTPLGSPRAASHVVHAPPPPGHCFSTRAEVHEPPTSMPSHCGPRESSSMFSLTNPYMQRPASSAGVHCPQYSSKVAAHPGQTTGAAMPPRASPGRNIMNASWNGSPNSGRQPKLPPPPRVSSLQRHQRPQQQLQQPQPHLWSLPRSATSYDLKNRPEQTEAAAGVMWVTRNRAERSHANFQMAGRRCSLNAQQEKSYPPPPPPPASPPAARKPEEDAREDEGGHFLRFSAGRKSSHRFSLQYSSSSLPQPPDVVVRRRAAAEGDHQRGQQQHGGPCQRDNGHCQHGGNESSSSAAAAPRRSSDYLQESDYAAANAPLCSSCGGCGYASPTAIMGPRMRGDGGEMPASLPNGI